MRRLIYAIAATWFFCGNASPGAETWEDLDRLIAAGQYQQALQATRERLANLSAHQRMTSWELDFRGEVVRVVPGRRCLYYQLSIPNSSADAPGRDQALPVVSANRSRSDWKHVVVCLDLGTGEIRWSRGLNGLVNLAVQPRSDDLYLWREKLFQLASASGEIVVQRELPTPAPRIAALVLADGLHLAQTLGPSFEEIRDQNLVVYDPGRDLVEKREVGEFTLFTPDESCRLKLVGSTWHCQELATGATRWQMPRATFNHPPLWEDARLLTYTGEQWNKGTVSAFNWATGDELWTHRLGWGAYSIRQHQLGGGGYPDETWRPLGRIEDYFITLDGSGRLLLLDPETGEQRLSVQLNRDHLMLPRQIEQSLVVCSFEWGRAYSLQHLLHPEQCPEAQLKIREARCLFELGDAVRAQATLDQVVDRLPHLEAAWSLRADISWAAGDAAEASLSACRAMALAGRQADETFHVRWGLRRLFDLQGRPAWESPATEHAVHAGTQDGWLWSIHPDSLETSRRQLDHEITAFEVDTQVKAMLGDSPRTRNPLELADPASERDSAIPSEWWTEGGEQRIGRSVTFRGRRFRPLKGGGVRVLEGLQPPDQPRMRDLPGRDLEIGVWSIHLAPDNPLGFGEGGVFELDEDLRPERVLYRPRIAGKEPQFVDVLFMQEHRGRLGLVVGSDLGASLQLCSREGELLAEAPLGRFISGFSQPDQLVPLADGFLFADRQLTWVGPRSKTLWQFGPSLERTEDSTPSDRWRFYGVPQIVAGRLFVTSLDGHLLIFDTERIAANPD